jgi:uncharacterized protein YndB with AHSA1/START domain
MKTRPFEIERTFDAPIERVWKAITDKNDMRQWYFDLEAFKPEVGFEFEFYGIGNDGKKFLHRCTVTEVILNRKLAYTWRYEGYPGNSVVTFELFKEGNRTRLKLTHEGLETFPPSPDFAKENFANGWTSLIGTLLKDFVEKTQLRS